MLDGIFNYISIAIIFLMSFGIYFTVAVHIMPTLLLKPLNLGVRHDRGIKKFVFPEGRSIAYEPSLHFRKYVSQYVLYSQNGKKFIKCKINTKIHDLVYDISVYDRKDKVLGVYRISQSISDKGYTPEVNIPDECSYVHFSVISANGEIIPEKENSVYSGIAIITYAAITVGVTVIEGLFCSNVVKTVFDIIYRLSNGFDYTYRVSFAPMIGISALCGCILAAVTIVVNIPSKSKIVFYMSNN
jgi:hypothetical protein